jgi:hypothetical protein
MSSLSLISVFGSAVDVSTLARLLQLEMRIAGSDIVSPTPVARGALILKELTAAGRVLDFTDCARIDDGGDAMITEAQLPLLQNLNEAELCITLYPLLAPLFEMHGSCLVNSERVGWIPQVPGAPQFNRKPDFFAAPLYLYYGEKAYAADRLVDAKLRALRQITPMKYGGMPWNVRDLLDMTIEVKEKYGTVGLGELEIYLGFIAKDLPDRCFEARGMFIWDKGFILTKSFGGKVHHITKALWHTPGSKDLISAFVLGRPPNPHKLAIELLCRDNNLTPEPCGYLGRGTRGVVIKCRSHGELVALKVVVGQDNVDEIEKELELLANFSKKADIITPCSCLLRAVDVNPTGVGSAGHIKIPCAGYLMKSVGVPAPHSSLSEKIAIVVSLNGLHKANIVHGDARLTNVVLVDEKLLWVDLMAGSHCIATSDYKADMRSLLRSLYGELSDTTIALLEQYPGKLNDPNVVNEMCGSCCD